jgi:hypothetical protein
MYPTISLITDFAKYREDDRPLIMIEFSHAMGNSNGSLADYWEARHTPDLKDTMRGPKGYYTLNLDIAQRGVGTGACGPDTLEKYRVRPGRFGIRLYIAEG